MCCGNCSVGENFLAKFEGYPAIIGIINMKLTADSTYWLLLIERKLKDLKGEIMQTEVTCDTLHSIKFLGVYKFCFGLFDI